MAIPLSLEDFWMSAPPANGAFDPERIAGLPEAARRYLRHAIPAGSPLSSAVLLSMHGEIKINGWNPFTAKEVICWHRGMIWQACVRVRRLPIRGGDSFVDGKGMMRWKLFGLVPVVNASGFDISRSAADRVNIESIWLPSVLCDATVSWTASDGLHPRAQFVAHGERAEIDYTINKMGELKTVIMPRWGDPYGRFGYFSCGGFVDEERCFDGYVIPSRMRVGWHFGTERFETDGEFFRVTIDDAIFR